MLTLKRFFLLLLLGVVSSNISNVNQERIDFLNSLNASDIEEIGSQYFLSLIDKIQPDYSYSYELHNNNYCTIEIRTQDEFNDLQSLLALKEATNDNILVKIKKGSYFVSKPLNFGLLKNNKLRIAIEGDEGVIILGDARVYHKSQALYNTGTHLVYEFSDRDFSVLDAVFSDGNNTIFMNDTGRKSIDGCHRFTTPIIKDVDLSTSNNDVWYAGLPASFSYLNGLGHEELKNSRISFTCASQNHIREILKIENNNIWFREQVGAKRVNGDYAESGEFSRFYIYNLPNELKEGYVSVFSNKIFVPNNISTLYVHTYGAPFIRVNNDVGFKGHSILIHNIRLVGFNGSLIHRVDKIKFSNCTFEGIASLGRVNELSEVSDCVINNLMASGLELRGDNCHFIQNKVSNLLLRQNGTCVGITAAAGQGIHIANNVFKNCGGAVVRSVATVEGVTSEIYKKCYSIIEYNEFYYTPDGYPERYSRNDHGVIYLPTNPNNAIIRHNIIHDVSRMIGIYLDEGAQKVKCYKNLIYNVFDDLGISMAKWNDTSVQTYDRISGCTQTYGNAIGHGNVIMDNIVAGPMRIEGGRIYSEVPQKDKEKWSDWYPNDTDKQDNGCIVSNNIQVLVQLKRERNNVINNVPLYDESSMINSIGEMYKSGLLEELKISQFVLNKIVNLSE